MGPNGRSGTSGGPAGLRSFMPYLVLVASVMILLAFSLWLPVATSQATSPATALALAPPVTINPTILAIGTPQPGQAFTASGTFQGNEFQVEAGAKVRLNGRYGADGEFGVVKGKYSPDMSVDVETVRVFGERKEAAGKPAPEIAIKDFKLSALRGKKVLVFFAASPG